MTKENNTINKIIKLKNIHKIKGKKGTTLLYINYYHNGQI